MTNGNWQQIWVEQCAAAETIKLRYGLKAAFDYAVAEKLPNFAEAAAQHPEFARELPRFVSRVRQMFTAQELVVHLARIERERRENDLPGRSGNRGSYDHRVGEDAHPEALRARPGARHSGAVPDEPRRRRRPLAQH